MLGMVGKIGLKEPYSIKKVCLHHLLVPVNNKFFMKKYILLNFFICTCNVIISQKNNGVLTDSYELKYLSDHFPCFGYQLH